MLLVRIYKGGLESGIMRCPCMYVQIHTPFIGDLTGTLLNNVDIIGHKSVSISVTT